MPAPPATDQLADGRHSAALQKLQDQSSLVSWPESWSPGRKASHRNANLPKLGDRSYSTAGWPSARSPESVSTAALSVAMSPFTLAMKPCAEARRWRAAAFLRRSPAGRLRAKAVFDCEVVA